MTRSGRVQSLQHMPLEAWQAMMQVNLDSIFLASPAARWITGADLLVDGGISTRPTW